MTRQEAYEILGVNEKSLKTDIETRYAMLVKRYRAEQNNDKLEEISLAYNIITGRYVEPVEDTPDMKKIVFGKTKKEWSNIWLYGKFKFLGIVAGTAFLVYFIYTIATNTPGDFKIAAVGNFYIPESQTVTDHILGIFEEFEKVDVTAVTIDPQTSGAYDAASQQKAMITMTVSEEDVIVVDSYMFERYAPMGAFMVLDELYEEIKDLPGAEEIGIEPVFTVFEDDEDNAEHICGISVGDSQLLNSIGLYGTEQILTISIKSERPETAEEYIRELMGLAPELAPLVTPIQLPEPTSSPVPSPTDQVSEG